jgi:Ca2+-binding EF-hand superfamily protein
MNSKLIAAIAVASILGSATWAAASGDDHGHRKGPKFSIEEMDTNGDQMISKDEIAAHAKARFDQVDRNDDGKLSDAEMAAHGEKEMTKRMKKRQAKMLKRMDADDDGMLSFDDMQAKQKKRMDKIFSRLDADADGMLSAEELEKIKHKGKRHGKKHGHEDGDHD